MEISHWLKPRTWAECLEKMIQEIPKSIALMKQIREKYKEDWEIELLCSEIMYEEEKAMATMRMEVERERKEIA